MRELQVDLGARSYPIHIGPGVFNEAQPLLTKLLGTNPLIISDDIVAPLYLKQLQDTLNIPQSLILPTGEAQKTQLTITKIYDFLLANRCGRDTTLLALGGGVIGDMVGFAAAT